MGFERGVTLHGGLPVPVATPASGSAFDIAGKGIAGEGSLVLSCERAAALAPGWDAVWQAASTSVTTAT